MKDYIVTIWLPFECRVERVDDEEMAISVAEDYRTLIDPLSGENTLDKILADAVEPTVWFWPKGDKVIPTSAQEADDTEDYWTPATWKHEPWCPSPKGHYGDCWETDAKAKGRERGVVMTIVELDENNEPIREVEVR